MNNSFFKILNLYIKRHSILRLLQIKECINFKILGDSIEFGSLDNKEKNFSNFFKARSKITYSNLKKGKIKTLALDLTKNLKIKSNKFNNVLLFNVLEHLPSYDKPLSEIYRILKKDGMIIGSTPFLYQVHGAPSDYFRFTKEFFEINLKKKKFKKIIVKTLGYGPFVASYSLLSAYLKFLPIISDLLLLIAFLLDTIIQLFVKTKLSKIFPIGIFFVAKK